MTNFARLLPKPLRRGLPAKSLAGIAASLATIYTALLLSATPAAAIVTTVDGVTVGVAPRISESYGPSIGDEARKSAADPSTYANPEGNPVLHGTGVYAIYWDPDAEYWSEWQSGIDTYLQSAGAASGQLESVFAVDAQYTDKTNRPASYAESFKGAYTYAAPYPTSGCEDPEPFAIEDRIPDHFGGTPTAVCLTSAQMAAAIEEAVAAYKLPKGMGNVYYLLTPPGVTVCLDGGKASGHCSDYKSSNTASEENSFCSYHSAINPGGLATGGENTILYAVIPWTAGGAGDGKLLARDQRPGMECQDAGIYASGHGYKLEEEKARNAQETEEFEKKDEQEKREAEESRALEGPHLQEPNQEECPSTAGTCDEGLFDPIVNQISLEQQDMVTDPLLNAWQDAHHYENTDECRFLFGPDLGGSEPLLPNTFAGTLYNQVLSGHNYYLNDAFSLAAERLPYPGVACLDSVNLAPKFTAPNVVNSGETVGFDGMESDIDLDAAIDYSASGSPQPTYATYTWNFGDGTPEVSGYAPGAPACETPWLTPCAASVFHSYEYGGTYRVTLTVTDVAGNTSSVIHEVTVDGPAAPSSGGQTSAGAGAAGAGSSGAQTTAQTGSSTTVPAPVAAAAIVSRTLKSTLRKGLVVRYSVNEQVAGHFEVLLSKATALRLGIGGASATGLPAGSAAQLVIAKAILVTTAGGHNTVDIQFSKRTAAKLGKLHKLSLMLRMIVRNAAKSPATTTVLSSVTLG